MPDPTQYHFKLPPYQGPTLPEPPVAWYPQAREFAKHCTSERTARGDGVVRALVVHATAGVSSAGAMSVMADHAASWHWLVPDEDEEAHGRHVWACAPEKRAAWHVRNDRSHPDVLGGAPLVNYWSLGVEVVNRQAGGDPFSAWQVEQTAELVRYAWSKYPHLVHVVSHAKLDPSRRSDPGAAFPWDRLRDLVLRPAPVKVAMAGAGAARRAAPLGTRADLPLPAAHVASAVRLVGPDGRVIAADARLLDGVAVGEVRPLVEALGFRVEYARADGRREVRLAARASAQGAEAAERAARARDGAGAWARPEPPGRDEPEDAGRAPVLAARGGRPARVLDVVRDTLDLRDELFTPTLVEVPPERPLEAYRRHDVPVLDQGGEGACTGFGLATVANYLLRARAHTPDRVAVSARMLYEMAKRYDEWPGERYEGSSARGAIKGWHKHGVCCDDLWPYRFDAVDRDLTAERSGDATRRPLGAYFRVNHRDLVAMHAAIAEAGVLFATATVHEGWDGVGDDGRIPYAPGAPVLGGHAFAIVGYDAGGLWLQNSWGTGWGKDGFAQVSYDDWLANGTDVWVARLGAPVRLGAPGAAARALPTVAGGSRGYVFEDLRPHVVSLGNGGRLRTSGTYGTSADDVARILAVDFPRLTAGWAADRPKRVLLYAHGGLVGEDAALQRTAEYRAAVLGAEVYPLNLIWKTDYWTTVGNILRDAVGRRQADGPGGGATGGAKDFLLDRLDDMLEPLARALSGRAAWAEMTENALLASAHPDGGLAVLARRIAALHASERAAGRPGLELHLVAHSAGAVLFAPLVPLLSGPGASEYGLRLETVTLWAPACTVALFDQTYRPAVAGGRVGRFALYTLTDEAEQDDHCAGVYHKSLLYLVSHAFEARPRRPFRPGTPLLGMERAIRDTPGLGEFLASGACEWVRAPNTHHRTRGGAPSGRLDASTARRHGDFDDDPETVRSTLARILGGRGGEGTPTLPPAFDRTRAGLRDVRRGLGQPAWARTSHGE